MTPPHPLAGLSRALTANRLASASLSLARSPFQRPPHSPPPPLLSVLVTATCKKRAVVESSCHRLCQVYTLECTRFY